MVRVNQIKSSFNIVNKNQMTHFHFIRILTILLCISGVVRAQGIARPNSAGIRFGSWSKDLSGFRFFSSGEEDIGASFSTFFYFTTHFINNWYWEFNIGGIGDAVINTETEEVTEITGFVPMVFGLRNDFLFHQSPGRFQPYYSFGLGPYIVATETNTYEGTETETALKFGMYGGTGINLNFTSWFAFNVDLKYHFINMSIGSPASGFNLNFGISFMWGKKREIFRIRDTRLIVSDIYPSYYYFYNTYPLALVTVQNTAGFPIEVNVRSKVSPFSSRVKESGFIELPAGEIKDIPVMAIFESNITEISKREPAVLDIEVEGRAGTTHTEQISAQIMVHSRNAWDGQTERLSFFVTPDITEIIQFSRNLVNSIADSQQIKVKNMIYAKSIFNELSAQGLRYQSDPNIPFYQDDRVQFPDETLKMGSGDCDDLTVLYASLLESLGIKTAFVEVRDPEKELAHLYLIFDSGVSEEYKHLVSSNEKRYLIRENHANKTSVWIPVETTLITRGFEEAWKAGALNYLQEAQMKNGLSEGWVQVIDVK